MWVKGSTDGSVTDATGKYTLAVPDNTSTLVVNFIEYVSQESEIAGRSTINISLVLDVMQLSEVVLIGYGTQIKAQVTGSVADFDAKGLSERPVQRLDQALVGQMAGVRIVQSSGVPGN